MDTLNLFFHIHTFNFQMRFTEIITTIREVSLLIRILQFFSNDRNSYTSLWSNYATSSSNYSDFIWYMRRCLFYLLENVLNYTCTIFIVLTMYELPSRIGVNIVLIFFVIETRFTLWLFIFLINEPNVQGYFFNNVMMLMLYF